MSRRVELQLFSPNTALASTAVVTSVALSMVRVSGELAIMLSMTGTTPDVKVEAKFGDGNGNFSAASTVVANQTGVAVHRIPMIPVLGPEVQIIITGNAGNSADTVLTRSTLVLGED